MYLLDYALPPVAKLSRAIQADRIDWTAITPLVDAILNTLDDLTFPVANRVSEVMDAKDEIEKATNIKITIEGLTTFQEWVAKPFVTMLKANISSRFVSQDIVSSISIFDPKKVPATDSSDLLAFGEDAMNLMLAHYGAEQPAETVDGDEYTKEALISPEFQTKWKTFRSCLSKKPKGTLYFQLTELTTSDMLRTMFPNISTLANICLSTPVSTASVERSFAQMKLIKTQIRNQIGQFSLSCLMKIAIEALEKLSHSNLDAFISVWNRKPRRIAV